VAEYSFGVASSCMKFRKQIIQSLDNDWLTGAKCLQMAMEISMRNTETNLKFMGKDQAGDLETKLTRLQDELNPSASRVWEELSAI